MALSFKLEVFEGPLDLLLSLIAKNKVEITDIPIALILTQYLEAVDEMREQMTPEVSGEFIVMAAELMRIKSRMLLPKPESEEAEDPRANLVRALLEYKQAKEHALLLKERYALHAGRIVKDTSLIDTSHDLPTDLDTAILVKAMEKVLARGRALPQLARRSEEAIASLLSTRPVPVSDRIAYLVDCLYTEGPRSFTDLILRCDSRSAVIATFLALLELIRDQRVQVRFPQSLTEDEWQENAEEEILFTLAPGAHEQELTSEFDQIAST